MSLHYLVNKANTGDQCPACEHGHMQDTGVELLCYPPVPVLKCDECECEAMGARRNTGQIRSLNKHLDTTQSS